MENHYSLEFPKVWGSMFPNEKWLKLKAAPRKWFIKGWVTAKSSRHKPLDTIPRREPLSATKSTVATNGLIVEFDSNIIFPKFKTADFIINRSKWAAPFIQIFSRNLQPSAPWKYECHEKYLSMPHPTKTYSLCWSV